MKKIKINYYNFNGISKIVDYKIVKAKIEEILPERDGGSRGQTVGRMYRDIIFNISGKKEEYKWMEERNSNTIAARLGFKTIDDAIEKEVTLLLEDNTIIGILPELKEE